MHVCVGLARCNLVPKKPGQPVDSSLGSRRSMCANIMKAIIMALATLVALSLEMCCLVTRILGGTRGTSMLKSLLVGAFPRRCAEGLAYAGQCLAINR